MSWLADLGWRLGQAAAGGTLAAGSLVTGIAFIRGGPPLAAAAGLGAAVTAVFFALGHTAQVLVARRGERFILVATLAAYAVQVVVATLLVKGLTGRGFDPVWLFAGLAAAVAGWVTGLILAFRQARIPVFDPPPDPAGETGVPLMTSPNSPDRLPGDERSEGQRR
jgi:hypothetical protein